MSTTQDRISSAFNTGNLSELTEKISDVLENPVIYTAVVIEYIENPKKIINESMNVPELKWEFGSKSAQGQTASTEPVPAIESLLTGNREFNPGDINAKKQIYQLPRNTILASIVNNKSSHKEENFEILYPFFPPHLSFPVKAGEKVWVFFENNLGEKGQGYWLCRKPALLQVDDVNYTHIDRASEIFTVLSETTSGGTDLNNPYTFPSGGQGISDDQTLPGAAPYDEILKASISYKNFTGEPVPRYTKKCGDLVIQGSNNTLISLGEDKSLSLEQEAAGEAAIATQSINTSKIKDKGAIDIVTGRGRLPIPVGQPDNAAELLEGAMYQVNTLTGGLVVENKRGTDYQDLIYKEQDKYNPGNYDDSILNEGDVDFINDLSRIYLSMRSTIDRDFDIQIQGITDGQEGLTGNYGHANDPSDRLEAPAIVLKTDQLRLVARQDLRITIGDKEKGSAVVFKPDGNIVFIPGPDGIIKLGGEDADKAILCVDGSVEAEESPPGTVTAASSGGNMLISSGGGTLGAGGLNGTYSSKILVK